MNLIWMKAAFFCFVVVSPAFSASAMDMRFGYTLVTEVFKDDLNIDHADSERLTLITSSTPIPQNGEISLSLNDWRIINSIDLDVEAIGADARMEVLVNGIVKASILIPGHDPHYFITIADAARSIELRQVSGGRIKVSRLVANLQKKASHQPPIGSISSQAARSSIDIIRNINEFSLQISNQEYEHYLTPVKIRAGRVYAKATASGDSNTSLNHLMTELLSQMQSNEKYIDKCLTIDALFEIATDYLANQYQLEELLN